MTEEQIFLLSMFILFVGGLIWYCIAVTKITYDEFDRTTYSSGLTQYDYDVKMARLYLRLLLLKSIQKAQENNTQNDTENTTITPPVLLLK